MTVERGGRRVSARRLTTLTEGLLEASTLCAIATVSPDGSPWVNTAYFAWTPALDLFWLSDPQGRHSRYLQTNPAAAIAVYDSRQTWGQPDRGLQLFGTAGPVPSAAAARAAETYAGRFPRFVAADVGAYRMYRFHPRRLKVFDERELGSGRFVLAKVDARGRMSWQRTEVSSPRR